MFLLRAFLLSQALTFSVYAQSAERSGDIPPEVTAYEVLDLMKEHVVTREQVNWRVLKSELDNLERPFTRETLREALNLILKRADTGHTFYKSTVEPKFVMQRKFECVATNTYDLPIIPGHIGYLRVNSFNAPSDKAKLRYIKELHDEINRQKDRDTKTWIIDFRYNSGGNMWPMLAAVAPLLSNGVHGYFVKPDGSKTAWGTYDGQSFLNNQFMIGVEKPSVGDVDMPIAVLSSEQTASSGEALLVAVKDKANVRSFGEPSCGMSTSNRSFKLSNGATLNITTAIMASKSGTIFGGRIPVDESSSRPVEDAIQWINRIVE
ncbi:S41 family peptidase [Idiomarina ramblicola]|uniref:Tail specific protease domain-containing protein n=1 Tax=Idiomarina ramblicola TaxID=263724 RepID=A0A432Z5I3_9GAMM|nr:S41 family peptidase [Idiomarina ramblicola]RUO73178.1 hypothetical protein CWI78_01680 [Idiomarina ramblicola]